MLCIIFNVDPFQNTWVIDKFGIIIKVQQYLDHVSPFVFYIYLMKSYIMGSIFKALSSWRPDDQSIPTKHAVFQSSSHTVSLCVPFLELNLLPFLVTRSHHAPIIATTTVLTTGGIQGSCMQYLGSAMPLGSRRHRRLSGVSRGMDCEDHEQMQV